MTSSITTTVNKTVTLGANGYTSPLAITSSGTIVGTAGPDAGIYVQVAGAVTNSGVIFGGTPGLVPYNTATGANGGAGVVMNQGSFNNLKNVSGGNGGQGDSLIETVYNGNGGAGLTLSGGIFSNTGTVTGGSGGTGQHFFTGQQFFDGSNAFGGNGGDGVLLSGGTLINTGSIIGGAGGANAGNPGFVGSGDSGIGIYMNGGTLITSGLVFGPNAAINFGANASTLIVEAGARFTGNVFANGINDELAIGGTSREALASIGNGNAKYNNFKTIAFESGAIGSIYGSIAGLAAGQVIAGFSTGDTIELTGFAATSHTYVSGTGLELNAGAVTLKTSEPAGDVFVVTSNGGNSTIQLFPDISFSAGTTLISGNTLALASGETISGLRTGDALLLDGFAATSETVINGTGIVLSNGASTETLDIAGSLASRYFLISAGGGNTTIISNLPSIISTGISSTVTLASLESLTVTSTGVVTPTATGATGLVESAAATGVYVLNQGNLNGAAGLNGAGASGNPTGGGIAVNFSGGASLVNTGHITGGAGGSSMYNPNAGGGDGIDLAAGDALINSGAVTGGQGGGAGRVQYSGGGGGTAINLASGSRLNNTGAVTGGYGGYSYGGPGGNGGLALNLASGATLVNTGALTGGRGGDSSLHNSGRGGTGVNLQSGASFANAGQITGGYGGYSQYAYGQTGGAGAYINSGATLINTGNIAGGHSGAGVHGLPSNGQRGGTGVQINGGVFVDSGAVAGGAGGFIDIFYQGPQGNAIGFGALAGTLVVDPGASFNGQVAANAAVADVLEVAGTSASALTGIGSNFTGFTHISFASGAAWSLAGNTVGLAAHQVITGFTFGDAIDLTGFAASGETFAAGSGLTLSNGTTSETLDLTGSFTGDEFLISTSGGTSMITLGTAGAAIAPGMVASLPAGSIASETISGGTLDVSAGSTLGALAITGGGAEISLSPGAALTVSTPLTLAPGATLNIAGGTLVVQGGLSLTGKITESGADLFDNGSLVNNGHITLDPSTLTVQGSLTGTGVTTLAAGSTLDVTGDISSGQTIIFAGTGAELQITDTADIAGTLSVTGSQAIIDITDLAPASFLSAHYTSSSELLGITYSGAASPLELHGNFAGQSFSEHSDGNAGTDVVAICYLRGTRILTPTGERPIEQLAIGDAVITRFGAIQNIRWIGEQKFDWRFIRNNRDKIPVRIAPGALGRNLPARELAISPGHSVLLGETLVLARDLVNGLTITQDFNPARDTGVLEYFQIELAGHDCIIAEGCWSETFADGPGLRAQFHNAAEFRVLYPEAPPPDELRLCAPRPEHGAKLNAALRLVIAHAWSDILPGRLEGCVERVSDWHVEGWALDTLHPTLPVLLEIWQGETLLGTTLARSAQPRRDLVKAGKGAGRCTFSFTSPARLTAPHSLSVRRQNDPTDLPHLQTTRRVG